MPRRHWWWPRRGRRRLGGGAAAATVVTTGRPPEPQAQERRGHDLRAGLPADADLEVVTLELELRQLVLADNLQQLLDLFEGHRVMDGRQESRRGRQHTSRSRPTVVRSFTPLRCHQHIVFNPHTAESGHAARLDGHDHPGLSVVASGRCPGGYTRPKLAGWARATLGASCTSKAKPVAGAVAESLPGDRSPCRQ